MRNSRHWLLRPAMVVTVALAGTATLASAGTAAPFPGPNAGSPAIRPGPDAAAVRASATPGAQTNTTTVLTTSPNPTVDQPTTLIATVTSEDLATCADPIGNVTFFSDGIRLEPSVSTSAPGPTGTETYTFDTTFTTTGAHSVIAAYSGSLADCNASNNADDAHDNVLVAATSTTTLTASTLNPSFGRPVTLTASVTCGAGATPTGAVTFYEGSTPAGTATVNGRGVATLTLNDLALGSHTFTARYGGDPDCAVSPPSNEVTVDVGGCTATTGGARARLDAERPSCLPPCTVTISGFRLGLDVTQATCVTPGTVIYGPVTVTAGFLDLDHATVWGNVRVTGGTGIRACGSRVTGNLSVSGTGTPTTPGFVIIGDAADDPGFTCAGNTLNGLVTLRGNTGFLELGANRITGNTVVDDNTSTLTAPDNATAAEIEANHVSGNLACTGNTPPPTNDGLPNTVGGSRTGQCTGL